MEPRTITLTMTPRADGGWTCGIESRGVFTDEHWEIICIMADDTASALEDGVAELRASVARSEDVRAAFDPVR
jgi:hypothetical protein